MDKLALKLQERLVQICIDFINEHKDDEHWNVYTSPALRCEDSGEVIEIKEV